MIIVFPNYAAKRNNGSFSLESSAPLLFNALTQVYPAIYIAATLDVSEQTGGYRPIIDQRVHFISLSNVGNIKRKTGKALNYIRILLQVVRTIYRMKFSYIFSPGHVSLLACVSCIILNRPFALYLRGDWNIVTPHIFRKLHKFIFSKAKFVLCTGTELTREITKINSCCEAVIPMSEILTRNIPPRSSYATPKGCRVLFVGALLKGKGIYELVDAMALVRKSGYLKVSLSIVGTGPESTQLIKYVDQRRLVDCVLFHGFVDDPDKMCALYCTHDIFCLPTYSEGFPRVIYEAMLFGMPIITTRKGQIPTIVNDDVNGLFVQVQNPENLAEKIITLVENEFMRQRLGQQARLTIEPITNRWRESTHGYQVIKWMRKTNIVL